MRTGDSRILKRLGGILAVGAAPAALLGFISEFLSPKGDWIIVLIVGVLAAAATIYLLLRLTVFRRNVTRSWWYRLTTSDQDMAWIWEGSSPWLAHGLHVVAVFALACLFIAGKSYNNWFDKAAVPKSVDAITEAQNLLRLNKDIARDVKETKDLLSTNRFDELVRLGFQPPDYDRFVVAIESRHYRAVELFLQTNIGLNCKISSVGDHPVS